MKGAMLVLACLLTASPAEKPRPKPKPSAQKCPDEKINFTQATACRHDGYVFCIPERDKKLLAAIKRIAPTAENYAHQRCGETELLFLVPIQQDESGFCVERGGAMTDKAWNQVCSLARQPRIAGIRPMHFE
jgi:hypothetical protein